ncbi:MAG: hypothetical protein IKV88_07005 [Clostridia bacterium]|nr:hypothetical protein [Clostridia bacterium]
MLKNINSTDILSSIELGCQMMGQAFNADDNDIPFFISRVWPKAYFDYHDGHAEAHVPGRHLNALLVSENVAGISFDEKIISTLRNAAFYSLSGPIPLPLNREVKEGRAVGEPKRFLEHNIREGMHAMYALSKFRNDMRADETMHKMIDFINNHFVPNMAWDSSVTQHPDIIHIFPDSYIQGIARSIGPLVKYYSFSGYEPALKLACCLAEKTLECFPENGEFNQVIMGTNHVHSITCVLSSLAQLTKATDNLELIQRVRLFYDNGLQELRNELGWAAELSDSTIPARGELNISGDILETALILAQFFGVHYYDDAERILRGHILPSQLRDNSFIQTPENINHEDRLRDVAKRHIGAFGFPAPYGHQPKGEYEFISFNTDIVGGTVASICEAYKACTSYENNQHHVELLFDKKTEYIEVISPYHTGEMKVTVKIPGSLNIRIPSWVEREKINVSESEWYISGDYIVIPEPVINKTIDIIFPIVTHDIVLHHRTHTLNARMYGDIVIAMENEGMNFTFFEEYNR